LTKGGPDGITASLGQDYVNGGPGEDTLNFVDISFHDRLTVDLQTGTATGYGSDTIVGIEDVYGAPAAPNRMTGDDGPNKIDGGAARTSSPGWAGTTS